MRRVPFLRRAHARRWGVQSEVSHFGAEDERSVNGESPARWHRLPSLIPTNTLNRPSWRFAHRRPEPVSAFCGAGRASAGRDRRDGGVFYGGKAKIRSHIYRAVKKVVFITRPFRGRRFFCLAFRLATAGDDQPLSNGSILPHRSPMEQAGTLP